MSKKHKQTTLMRHFSTLAGALLQPSPDQPQTVQLRSLMHEDGLLIRAWTIIIACGSLFLLLGLDAILFVPSHWIITLNPGSAIFWESWIMLVCLAFLQLFILITSYSATRATLKAKNPVPLTPPDGLRVAFVTTRAPGEPVELVRNTLLAARRVRYTQGQVTVWLLDETKDPLLIKLCRELGIEYFSRYGIPDRNTTPKKRWFNLFALIRKRSPNQIDLHNPFFAARSKHGNFNAWLSYIASEGIAYDILAGVDTDHVPERNYLERLLGYFHDPDVAYVVGPQVYGNYAPGLEGLVVRWAESQASFFQSSIQRAGNASFSPMFVGTNYAVRISVLQQIGGFQPCITEDMATGLAIHTRRNPLSGKRWKSVYTPDVVAVGQGPDMWGSYFTQQWRWAAGTFDTWKTTIWRRLFKLSPRALAHYFLILTFYPIVSLTWLLGVVSSLIYLVSGATAILAPWNQFASLYLMTIVMQFSLYFWNRRFNVSPHEPEGTYGIPGIVLTSLTAPIYLSAFIGIAIGKRPHFVVTNKGDTQPRDKLLAFRTHLGWAAVLLAGLLYGLLHGHDHPAMLIWIILQLLACLTPILLNMSLRVSRYRKPQVYAANSLPGEPSNAV